MPSLLSNQNVITIFDFSFLNESGSLYIKLYPSHRCIYDNSKQLTSITPPHYRKLCLIIKLKCQSQKGDNHKSFSSSYFHSPSIRV